MSKLLIIGKNGFLGSVIASDAQADFDVVALSQSDMDITNLTSVEKIITAEKPDVIINAAAMAKVEACEQDPEQAIKLNALGAYNVAKASAGIGSVLVYISTDYVFDGRKNEYSEEDMINPLNVYGIAKAAGENFVKAYNSKHYIVRSAVFFGKSPSKKTSFVDLMIKLATEGKEITVVDDIYMSPTSINDLSKSIYEIITKEVKSGVYHVTNEGQCSWYDFAKKIFEIAGIEADLNRISANEQDVRANRPRHSALISIKLEKANISKLRTWQEALGEYIKVNYLR